MRDVTSFLHRAGYICYIARINQNITQKEVAIKLGMSQQNISEFEYGKNNNAIILFYYMLYIMSEPAASILIQCYKEFLENEN